MDNVRLSPRKVTLFLLLVVTGLLIAGTVTQFIRLVYGHDVQFGLVRMFDLDGENNLPSWYSSLALLLSAVALGVIGLHHRREADPWAWHWLMLAMLFLCLSADEAASIHEMAAPLLQRWLETRGSVDTVIPIIGTAWLLAGIPFVAIVLVMYWRFLHSLPVLTRTLFVVSGALFISGAVGMEAAGGRYLAHNGGIDTLTYEMMIVVEEGLEMVGIVLFLYALMRYIETQSIILVVRMTGDQSPIAVTPVLPDRPEKLAAEKAA